MAFFDLKVPFFPSAHNTNTQCEKKRFLARSAFGAVILAPGLVDSRAAIMDTWVGTLLPSPPSITYVSEGCRLVSSEPREFPKKWIKVEITRD